MMIDSKNDCGLCMTCNNAPTCFYQVSRGPCLVCELFDGYAAPPVRAADARPFLSAAVFAADDDASAYTGLCVNCDHRANCRNAKTGSGVWHCEDYR